MMSRFVKQKSVTVTGIRQSHHLSCLAKDLVLISDICNNLILTNTAGEDLHHLTDIVSNDGGVHTVNSDQDLIYIDRELNINKVKLSKVNNGKSTLMKYVAPWRPQCVYSSPSTGDLLVAMYKTGRHAGKVTRYTYTSENIPTIQQGETHQGLYSRPYYITENQNGDVIVSDYWCGVVVTNRRGRHLFSYRGPPSGSGLLPRGICTDALSHILVCDANSRSVHMIDKDGRFLLILKIQEWMYGPCGLCYDDQTNLLWVGSWDNNTVNIYKYIYEGENLKGTDVREKPKSDFPKLKHKHGFQTETQISVESEEKTTKGTDVGERPRRDFPKLNQKHQKHGFQTETQISVESEEKTTKEKTFLLSLLAFNKKLEELRENREAEFRIQRLTSSLNIETAHRQSYEDDHMESTEYEDIIQRVDYLDCSGLHLNDDEKQSKSFEPFSQSSVDDFLRWMDNCEEVFQKKLSPKCRIILSILFSAYTKEAILKLETRNISLVIYRCMDNAIKNKNHVLILSLVRSYFKLDLHLQKHFKDKEINSVVMDTLLQAAKCNILRECPRLRQNAISLSFCCKCSRKDNLVLMMLYKGDLEMKDKVPEEAMGVKLLLYNYTQPSDEASTVFNSIGTSFLLQNVPGISEKDARKLFKKHSNLTLISASPFKSTGYLEGKHKIVKNSCISLLCLHKGFMPFGEREFPRRIHGFEVDVQEGYCFLGSGRSIDFGGHIRRARGINTPGNGSIGGFVDLQNDLHNPNRDSVGLITCAHVVFSTDELKIPREEFKDIANIKGSDFEVEVFDKKQHRFQVCGNIADKCFPEWCSDNNNSVDAALIKLDPTVNEFGFPVTLADQFYSAGFDPNEPPVFKGEVVNVPDPHPFLKFTSKLPDRLDSVVKYGSKTRFTIGSLYSNGVHVRFVDETGNLPDRTRVVMCNQIEIQSLPQGTFFEAGDSGAFVFCINPDKTLSCLGMAIGSSTKGSCFVTPIVRILDSFNLPHRLKPCPSYIPGDTSRVSENSSNSNLAKQSNTPSEVNLEALILDLKTEITSMHTSLTNVQNQQMHIQSSLHNIQTKVDNLETKVQETKSKYETEVGDLRRQVQTEVGDFKVQVQEIKNQQMSFESSSDINHN